MALLPGRRRLRPLLPLPPPTPPRLHLWLRRACPHQLLSRPVAMRPKMECHINQTDINIRRTPRDISTVLLRTPSADSQLAGSAVWTTWGARTMSIITRGRRHGRDHQRIITKVHSGHSAKRTCKWSDEHTRTGPCQRIAREPVHRTCRTARRTHRLTVRAAALPPQRRTLCP